jgi:PilZ domain-containing protein
LQAFAALETSGKHANDQAFCAVRDVSRHGIGMHTGQPPFVGQEVRLRLAIGEDIHTITTRATRVTKRKEDFFEVGLDWSRCTPADLSFLRTFLTIQDDD